MLFYSGTRLAFHQGSKSRGRRAEEHCPGVRVGKRR